MNVSFVSLVEDFLYELWRNEVYAFAVAHYEIARHDGDIADAERNINSSQHDVANGRGIYRTEIGRHVYFGNSVQVTNAAIHDQAASACGLIHIEEQIVTNDGTAPLFAEEIDYQHICGLQHVDCGLIEKALAQRLLSPGLRNIIHVFAQRHELDGECTAHHHLAWMQDLESIRVLIVESLRLQDRPHLFGRKFSGAFDQRIGNFGSAIGQAIEWILRGVVDQVLSGELNQLGFSEER